MRLQCDDCLETDDCKLIKNIVARETAEAIAEGKEPPNCLLYTEDKFAELGGGR